ncbi:hypothetical protein [Enterobacter hormaechei]|nr:hypothetical protein [Enterobacter hormaechei]
MRVAEMFCVVFFDYTTRTALRGKQKFMLQGKLMTGRAS